MLYARCASMHVSSCSLTHNSFDGLRDRREKRCPGKLFIAPTDYMSAPKPDVIVLTQLPAVSTKPRPWPRELKLKSELTRCFEKEWVLDAANKQLELALAILYSSWVGLVSYPNRYKLQLLANSMACRRTCGVLTPLLRRRLQWTRCTRCWPRVRTLIRRFHRP